MSIALWCVLFAGLMPIAVGGLSKKLGGNYDNNDPRGQAVGYTGVAKRTHAAHQNSFEAFPLFAVAVVVAEMKGAPRGMVDMLALAFVGFRLSYVATYMADQSTLRSVVWTLALFSTIGIFISPLWN
jgi:uncharacterized MAPEG superfamily protein